MDKNIEKLIEEGAYTEVGKAAYQLRSEGEFGQAEQLYSEIYDHIIDAEGRSSEVSVGIMMQLAGIAFEQHRLDSALSMYNSVLDWCRQNGAEDSFFALDAMISIAGIYGMYSRYDDKYDICRKALDIALNAYGEEDDMTCDIIRNLADSCAELYRYDEAMTYYELLLDILYRAENVNYSTVASAYDGMGWVSRYRGLPKKAKEYFEKGVRVLEESSKGDSEHLVSILNDLAGVYELLYMHDEELALREDIHIRVKKLYRTDHYNIMVSESNLAGAYASSGDIRKAVEMYEECVRWAYNNLGENNHETIRNIRRLSVMYSYLGRYDEAMDLAQKAYSLMSETLDEYHIEMLMALEDIGFRFIDLKNYRAAKEIFTKTSEYFRDNYGVNSDYFYSMVSCLYTYALLNEYSEVLSNADKLLELSRTFDEEADIRELLHTMALAHKGMGNYSEALRLQKEVVRISDKKYGPYNMQTFEHKETLAEIYFRLEEYSEALQISEMICAGTDKQGIRNNEYYKAAVLCVRCLSAMGIYDKACGLAEELLSSADTDRFRAQYSDVCYAAAENYRNMGRDDKALELSQKCLEYRENIYEEDSGEIKEVRKLCSLLMND